MHVLIINFRLAGMDEEGYRAAAPSWRRPSPSSRAPAKVWLAPADRRYGGVYLSDDRASMEATGVGAVRAVAASPAFADISSRDFPVYEDLTRITAPGLPVAA